LRVDRSQSLLIGSFLQTNGWLVVIKQADRYICEMDQMLKKIQFYYGIDSSDYGAPSLPYDYEEPLLSKKPRKWPPITLEMHKKIKQLYLNKRYCSGEVKKFARQHGLPRWKITRYAQRMGWIAKQKKAPVWTDREIRILKQNAHHSPETIQRRLKRIGFRRSLASIILKRKRMRFIANIDGQSANSLAMCLGEDGHFVTKMIKNGLLKAKRRIQNRTPQQGGNVYIIRDKDVKDFIVNNIHMIDLRKVDKYWFVDILTN